MLPPCGFAVIWIVVGLGLAASLDPMPATAPVATSAPVMAATAFADFMVASLFGCMARPRYVRSGAISSPASGLLLRPGGVSSHGARTPRGVRRWARRPMTAAACAATLVA